MMTEDPFDRDEIPPRRAISMQIQALTVGSDDGVEDLWVMDIYDAPRGVTNVLLADMSRFVFSRDALDVVRERLAQVTWLSADIGKEEE